MADVERYAIVRGGKVENVTLWDGEATWSPPEGTTAVKDAQGKAQVGGGYAGGTFTGPPATEPVAPHPDDVLLDAAKEDVTVVPLTKAIIRKVRPDVPKPPVQP